MNTQKDLKRNLTIYLLPNIITSCSIFCGFFSIVRSILGQYDIAAYAIIFAAVFDALDGRVARMTGGSSAFGEQYDSLSDAVSFGVAPAILMFTWSLQSFGRIGWLVSFLFMACGALRLARFNVQKNVVEKNFFQGLPIPIAAGTVASSVLLFYEKDYEAFRSYYMLALTFVLAALMVSSLRYRNFKNISGDKRKSIIFVVAIIIVLIFIALKPEVNLFIIFFAYVVYGILGNLFKFKRYKEAIKELKDFESIPDEEESQENENK